MPAGIGPEIVLKTLSSERVRSLCDPLVLGGYEVLALASQIADFGRDIVPVTTADAPVTDPSTIREVPVTSSTCACAAQVSRRAVALLSCLPTGRRAVTIRRALVVLRLCAYVVTVRGSSIVP